jgi:hypothetical protein
MSQSHKSNVLALGNVYHNPNIRIYAWTGTAPFTAVNQLPPAERETTVRVGDVCFVRDDTAVADCFWRCTNATNQAALVWATITPPPAPKLNASLASSATVNIDTSFYVLPWRHPSFDNLQGDDNTAVYNATDPTLLNLPTGRYIVTLKLSYTLAGIPENDVMRVIIRTCNSTGVAAGGMFYETKLPAGEYMSEKIIVTHHLFMPNVPNIYLHIGIRTLGTIHAIANLETVIELSEL